MPKRAAETQYESDGGFVEDVPKSKKSKKFEADLKQQKDGAGNTFWEISGKRRVGISQFKGNYMVGIREFYEKDGETLPGKKGISMTLEQYNAVVQLLPQIERALKSHGIKDVARPDYARLKDNEAEPDDENEERAVESEADDEQVSKPSRSKLDQSKHQLKQNHEATSDEDEE